MAKNQQFRRILLAAAMTSFQVGVLLAANPGLRSSEPPTQREVNVYLENIPDVSWDVDKAKTITSQIFSAIRVKLIWVTLHHERTAFPRWHDHREVLGKNANRLSPSSIGSIVSFRRHSRPGILRPPTAESRASSGFGPAGSRIRSRDHAPAGEI